jgi:uncharacterized protein (TIGR03083 family)
MASPWPTIHSERQALADDLEGLTDKQLETPSLCTGWSVRAVLAHMTGAAEMTPITFLPKLAGSGFKLTSLNEKNIAERVKGSPADTFARFKSRINSSKHPPGPVETWLGETIVHSEDIRRPLNISHDYPVEALIRVANSYAKSNLVIGGKRRASGLTLRATDADWTTGSGAEVAGSMVALVLALTGRGAALKDLEGEGVATLTSRM